MSHLPALGRTPELWVVLVGVPVTVAAVTLMISAMRRRDRTAHRAKPAVRVTTLAALGCTAYSCDTSWAFAADYLDMSSTGERVLMFGVGELALVATALMARENLTLRGAPGLPGTLVWLITGVQVVPAYAESGLIGGTVRAAIGPVLAATLWHLAMGIELRLRIPDAASTSILATLGREARKRLLSRLGIATRDRDAEQITRDRATRRAETLCARLADRSPRQRGRLRGRRQKRQLQDALSRAEIGSDPEQKKKLLAHLAVQQHALGLPDAPLADPWRVPADAERADTDSNARPVLAETGTRPHENPGPVPTQTGTRPHDNPEPVPTQTGTRPHDNPEPVPVRRKPTPRSKASRGRGAGSSGRPSSKETKAKAEALMAQVQPHVAELLERDGNAALTRDQLREILQREKLPGGRNEILGEALKRLRAEESQKESV